MEGHSLGGLIAFHYGVTYPDTIAALVLSGAAFRTFLRPKAHEQALAPLLSRLAPRLQFSARDALRPELVCRDPAVVRAYATDPLVGRTASVRYVTEATRALIAARSGMASRLRLPVLILHGGDDRLNDPAGSQEVFGQIPHGRKQIRIYPGKYHDIFNDPGYDQVLGDIAGWLAQEGLAPA